MASCIPDELTQPAPASPRDNLDGDHIPAGADSGDDGAASQDRPTSSVFARGDGAPVHNVPMRVIHRPLPSELDEDKVLAFMDEMRVSRLQRRLLDSVTTRERDSPPPPPGSA
jgi:sulfiredoxin